MPLPKNKSKKKASPASPVHSRSFSIRPARVSDQAAILELARVLFPNSTPAFGANDRYYVAIRRGALAGWVHLHPRPRSVYLQGLAVRPTFRRQGIGQALLRLALKVAARRHPGQMVALKVKSSNAPALQLYLREGFLLRAHTGPSYLLTRPSPN